MSDTIIRIGKEDAWPMYSSLWDFYKVKGKNTVFFSVGSGLSALAEADLLETLGCSVHIWDPRPENHLKWKEVIEILTTRKRPDSATPFSKGIDEKWILPKRICLHPELPASFTGSGLFQGSSCSFQDLTSCVDEVCKTMDVPSRIDLLKIQLSGAEREILFTLLNSPYRPGLILVEWSIMPDADLLTTCCAGHLTQCGYVLIGKEGSHFLYLYKGDSAYEICSWEQTKYDNPLTAEIYLSKTE